MGWLLSLQKHVKDITTVVQLSEGHFLTAYFLKAICSLSNRELKQCSELSEDIQKVGETIRERMDRGYCDLGEIDSAYKSFYSFYNSESRDKNRWVSHMGSPEELCKLENVREKLLFVSDAIATVALHRLYYNKLKLEYSLKKTGKKVLGAGALIIGIPTTLIAFPVGIFGCFISFCKSMEGGIYGGNRGESKLGKVLMAPMELGCKLVDKGGKELEEANLSLLAPSKIRKKLIQKIEKTFPNAKHELQLSDSN